MFKNKISRGAHTHTQRERVETRSYMWTNKKATTATATNVVMMLIAIKYKYKPVMDKCVLLCVCAWEFEREHESERKNKWAEFCIVCLDYCWYKPSSSSSSQRHSMCLVRILCWTVVGWIDVRAVAHLWLAPIARRFSWNRLRSALLRPNVFCAFGNFIVSFCCYIRDFHFQFCVCEYLLWVWILLCAQSI